MHMIWFDILLLWHCSGRLVDLWTITCDDVCWEKRKWG